MTSKKRDVAIQALRRVATMADAYLQGQPTISEDDDAALRLVELLIDVSASATTPKGKHRGKRPARDNSLFFETRRPFNLDVPDNEVEAEVGIALNDADIAEAAKRLARSYTIQCHACRDTGVVHSTNRLGQSRPTGVACSCSSANVPSAQSARRRTTITDDGEIVSNDLPFPGLLDPTGEDRPSVHMDDNGRLGIRLRSGCRLIKIGYRVTPDEREALTHLVDGLPANTGDARVDNLRDIAVAVLNAYETGLQPRPRRGRTPDPDIDVAAPPTPAASDLEQLVRMDAIFVFAGTRGGARRFALATSTPKRSPFWSGRNSYTWRGVCYYAGMALPTNVATAFGDIAAGRRSGVRVHDIATVRRIWQGHLDLNLTSTEQLQLDADYELLRLTPAGSPF